MSFNPRVYREIINEIPKNDPKCQYFIELLIKEERNFIYQPPESKIMKNRLLKIINDFQHEFQNENIDDILKKNQI